MKTNPLILLAFAIAMVFSSCNQTKLNDDEAKDLVNKALMLPQDFTVELEADTRLASILQNNGLITYQWVWEDQWGTHSADYKFECTDKGKPFYLGESRFKTNSIDFNGIKGVSVNKDDQTATVRFSVIATNVTPVAQAIQGTKFLNYPLNSEINGELVFKKFDNGWQLQSNQNITSVELLIQILNYRK